MRIALDFQNKNTNWIDIITAITIPFMIIGLILGAYLFNPYPVLWQVFSSYVTLLIIFLLVFMRIEYYFFNHYNVKIKNYIKKQTEVIKERELIKPMRDYGKCTTEWLKNRSNELLNKLPHMEENDQLEMYFIKQELEKRKEWNE